MGQDVLPNVVQEAQPRKEEEGTVHSSSTHPSLLSPCGPHFPPGVLGTGSFNEDMQMPCLLETGCPGFIPAETLERPDPLL